MTCAKREVYCKIIPVFQEGQGNHPNNSIYTGSNGCLNPQRVCPRLPDEGYEKCRSICKQAAHAEMVALLAAQRAGAYLVGATVELFGHWNMCKDCAKALADAGIVKIIIHVQK